MPSLLNHTPDAQAPTEAAASTNSRKPFIPPSVQLMPSLQELTRDVETTFTVQGTAGSL